jgi:hypothetical protein
MLFVIFKKILDLLFKQQNFVKEICKRWQQENMA